MTMQVQLKRQTNEHEAIHTNNQKIIDHILSDRDALRVKCGNLAEELSNAEARCRRQLDLLKEELTKELKKQKVSWDAIKPVK